MRKVEKLLKSLNEFIQKAEDDEEQLTDIVPDFPGLDGLPVIIEDYETAIARLLRAQRKRFLDEFNTFISKDDKPTLEAFLVYLTNNLFAADEFAEEFGEETAKFLTLTVEELTKVMMDSIDKDIQFEVLSGRTVNWIKDWSFDLADIMRLNTHRAIENVLVEGIQDGLSIQEIELKLKDMPQFDRKRARTTARTEILTASSRAHYESFVQSPAVTGKKWKHSGSKKNNPRETHVAMDGVTIPVDDYFYVDGESGLYPRDPSFTAKNRVNCGCVLGPVVDEVILGLSKDEKEKLRQEALDKMGGAGSTNLESNDIINDKVFTPISDIDEWEEKVSPAWLESLTVGEQSAINEYTGSDYKQINEYLRTGKTGQIDEKDLQESIQNISDGLRKFDLKEDIITYRGIPENIYDIPFEMLEGMELSEKAFVSTSLNRDISFNGAFSGGIEMIFHVPAGSNGAYINAISKFDNEKEFLLDKGTRYIVKSAVKEGGKLKMIVEVLTNG